MGDSTHVFVLYFIFVSTGSAVSWIGRLWVFHSYGVSAFPTPGVSALGGPLSGTPTISSSSMSITPAMGVDLPLEDEVDILWDLFVLFLVLEEGSSL